MIKVRHKDQQWMVDENAGFPGATLCVLMDLRDELKRLNAVFACHNTQEIPDILRRISCNTARKTKRRK